MKTTVLVVGAGPTGMTAAILLRRLGIDCRVIDKREGPQRAPAAHVVNARSFEIWRQAGCDMNEILGAAKSPVDAGRVYWVDRLGGEILGDLPFERQDDAVLADTPTPLRNLTQHRLEPILAAQLDAIAPGTLYYRHSWQSAQQDDTCVRSRIEDLDTGNTYEIESEFVIAADGAGSPIRRSLGIQPIGPDRLQAFLMIHFGADLRSIVRDCPGVLYWISDPACSGTLVAHDIDREWVLMRAWDPDQESLADYPAERCEALVREAIRPPAGPIEIRTISSWMMTSQVAERYQEGRIFLAGDAAHRFPPTGGMGLNTGVQDAHNLAWKVAEVVRGSSGPELLATYETERRPVAQYNTEQSFLNAARMMEVPQAMGTAAPPEEASANFAAMLADAGRRAEVAKAIANQAEHFDMLGLQLGYRYEAGAFLDDGSEWPKPENSVRQFLPCAKPGSRLPHAWLTKDGETISSLDLVGLDRHTVLAGPDASLEGKSFPEERYRILRVGRDFQDSSDWWSRILRMSAQGYLVVRPDQHIRERVA